MRTYPVKFEVTEEEAERFWAKTDPDCSKIFYGGKRCWEWGAACFNTGYGQFRLGGRKGDMRLTHRVAWTLVKGQPPEGKLVLHRCDNRKCVRPSHLFLGTHADNAIDRETKGRGTMERGSKNLRATLTKADVLDIRRARIQDSTPFRTLARKYGVSHVCIIKIVQRETWKHVA